MDFMKTEFTVEDGLNVTKIYGVKYFDVGMIFDCGQAFRFDPVTGTEHECEYGGVAPCGYISVASDGDTVTIYNCDEKTFEGSVKHWLGLDEEYGAYMEDIRSRSDVPALHEALRLGSGIRILRQEPWEALCSFIISQNNNIPRIKGLIRELSKRAGVRTDVSKMRGHGAGEEEYLFPTPEAVMALGTEALKEMKTGFRAPYIYGAAEAVSGGTVSLESVMECPTTGEASLMLQTLKGVGPKVAACTLLFGFGRMDAFPVDVWMKKVIAKYFPGEFSPEALGPYAGLAQQYLFNYERNLLSGTESRE